MSRDTAEVESREDEEQGVKLAEILELLVAAGYFRARIKGLSPFDKVVGGMTWCITTCNFDIDVDLLFQENSTIGQKIALTEKIVSVLPKMKCPHRLEPHQIQGLDFIHIFPVIQWLVKRAIETRQETGDYIRAFSVSQFQKDHRLPEDEDFAGRKEKALRSLADTFEIYNPRRKYRRQEGAAELTDEESRVHSTLLEYGRRYGSSRPGRADKPEEHKMAAPSGLAGKGDSREEEELQAQEELCIKALMTGMAAMDLEEGRVTASSVGQIVGLQSEEIKQMASEYAEKVCTVSATHKETKQFFTLYNTLDDKKVYLEKEVNLLNSIHDNFLQAMASSGTREQFLRQMEQIVDGIRQNRNKMEKKKQENKMRRDQLNDQYLDLLDKQRLYFKIVKEFKEECRKNEVLLSKLKERAL
ncbi:coiled-coil domain-containing protein 93 [Gastrophryne carolinensis]